MQIVIHRSRRLPPLIYPITNKVNKAFYLVFPGALYFLGWTCRVKLQIGKMLESFISAALGSLRQVSVDDNQLYFWLLCRVIVFMSNYRHRLFWGGTVCRVVADLALLNLSHIAHSNILDLTVYTHKI